MIRALSVSLAALIGAAPALGAEGGAIRSGEHAGFSRIVMLVEPTTEWSLETSGDRARILFPGKALDFGTAGVFEKIPRSRITDVRSGSAPEGTIVEVDLGCDCRVSTSFVGARYLALDVSDRDAPRIEPAPVAEAPPEDPDEPPAERAARESAIVASAEQVLIAQIERAASQGLIALSDSEAPEAEPEPEPPVLRELALAPPEPSGPERTASPAPAPPPRSPEPTDISEPADPLDALLDHEQIEATTVFDRDRRTITERLRQAAVPPECISDAQLEVGRWSNGTGLLDQRPALMTRLVGEFDRADPEALAALVRLHIRFGFGLEAELLLDGFPLPLSDRALLVDLARAVESRPVSADGPLSMNAACPGRHGLWQAVGGAVPAFRSEAHFATVQAAFAELPPDLRALVGPRLVSRLLDAGRSSDARLILDTAERPGQTPDPAFRLSDARLDAAAGDPASAVRTLAALVEGNAPNATEALMHLVRIALDADLSIPERTIVDLRAALLQSRGTEPEAGLRALLAETLASHGDLRGAIAEIRQAKAALPEARHFDALAAELLATADPERVGRATYAEVALGARDLIATGPEQDAARMAVAERLLALGLAAPAGEVVAPAAAREDAARLTLARALLQTGEAEKTRLVLTGMAGREAATLRALSFARQGALDEASEILTERGLSEAAEPLAWPSGDWIAATEVAPEPQLRTMSAYMAARDGTLPPPPPDPAPEALPPARAFLEPLPRLDRPSLDAARRLLAAGPQVGAFVATALGEEPAEETGPGETPGS